MPNHVTTQCTVQGPAADVAKFRADLFDIKGEDEREFDFAKIVPVPPEVLETESSTDSVAGLWAHRGVGSKWGVEARAQHFMGGILDWSRSAPGRSQEPRRVPGMASAQRAEEVRGGPEGREVLRCNRVFRLVRVEH
jgi:hypothetical protein